MSTEKTDYRCDHCKDKRGRINRTLNTRLCEECRVLPEYKLICKSTVLKEYFVPKSCLTDIECYEVCNPHYRCASAMILYKIQDILDYIKGVAGLGVGEIYLNSMDRDGTGFGYDKAFLEEVAHIVDVPIIASGGAGNYKHFLEVLDSPVISAAATANLLNFIGDGLEKARMELLNQGIDLPRW